jgi:hypothetical protein
MENERARQRFLLLVASSLAGVLFAWAPKVGAQTCPHSNVYKAAPIEDVLTYNSVEVIFRSAAIAGDTIAPALLRLSKPGMTVNSVPGAAQVSLARLGDKTALGELEKELNDPNSSYKAVPKLVRVGTDSAVSILMGFLRAHVSDNSLYHDFGDYSTDIRLTLIVSLSEQLQIGPVIMPDGVHDMFSFNFEDWVTWWDRNKGKPITLSISRDFRDPYLQCLARKIEWGFPDAIFDLARTRDPQVIPVLKHLARFSGRKRNGGFNISTMQGRAQLGLAQLGDPEELQTITTNLDFPGFGGAIEEFRRLGGPVAIAALIDALDSSNYLSEYKGTPGYQRVVDERNQAIEDALATMVIAPPETTVTPETAKKWKAWWEKNKDTAQFVKAPVTTYE